MSSTEDVVIANNNIVASHSKVLGVSLPLKKRVVNTDSGPKIRSPVRTRVFVNSAYNSRNVNGCLAKGNKASALKTMITCYERARKSQGECVQVNNTIVPEAKPIFCTEKGVKECVTDHNEQISHTSIGVKSMKGKEGGVFDLPVNEQINTMTMQLEGGNSDTPSEWVANDNEQVMVYDTKGQAKPISCSEKGVKECVTDYNEQISDTSIGVEPMEGKEGGALDLPVNEQINTMAMQLEGGNSDTPSEWAANDNEKVLLYDTKGLDEDKFVHTVLNKRLSELAKRQAELYCHNYRLWKQQSRFDFGFVPLSDFIQIPVRESFRTDTVDPSVLHKLIKASGTYNFLGLKIPVHSQLNVHQWVQKLEGYWDTQLLELIKYGFPMDFNRQSPLRWEDKNHSSALQFPHDVEAYLKEEIQFGAIQGPFIKNPIENCHFSPFLTREKSNASHRRVIIDLSWPKDASVNLGVDKNSYLASDFQLTFPTVDDIIDAINDVGKGACLYKVDISRAFRHVKIDPFDYDLLGLKWRDVTFFDTCLPFGSRHGTQIFQRLSDAVRYMMRREGFDVINYVDDFVGIDVPSVARRSYDRLCAILGELGLDVSVKKLVAPCTKAICLGVEIDTVQKTIAIPEDKMRRIEDILQEWKSKTFASRQQLQSLLGNLLYIHKCVRPARTFVNRMLQLLRDNYDKKSISLTHDFRRDLRWFVKFVRSYNGTSYFDHKSIEASIELDACLTGFGGSWGNCVYHVPIEKRYKNLAITQLETLNILVALRLFAPYWHRKKVHVKCDNLAAVQVLTSGKTRDPFLAACARNVWLVVAQADIQVKYSHIPGSKNELADTLSRWKNSEAQVELLHKNIRNPVWMHIPCNILHIDDEI